MPPLGWPLQDNDDGIIPICCTHMPFYRIFYYCSVITTFLYLRVIITNQIYFHEVKSRLTRRGECIFSIHLILPASLAPGGYWACNRNEYQKQKNFLRSRARPVRKADILPPYVSQLSRQCGILNVSQPSRIMSRHAVIILMWHRHKFLYLNLRASWVSSEAVKWKRNKLIIFLLFGILFEKEMLWVYGVHGICHLSLRVKKRGKKLWCTGIWQ
jgi:hypothetical protein